MNTDIEDFISTKNRLGSDDYNNFNPDDWDIPTCKNLFITLLNWIQNKRDAINIGNNNILNKEFQLLLNRELRNHKLIGNMRKSILLNILNKTLKPCDFPEQLKEYLPLFERKSE